MNFEKSIKSLDEIVKKIQSGDLQLDESLKLFEEGTKLANDCIKQLDEAEIKIKKLCMDGTTEDFSDES